MEIPKRIGLFVVFVVIGCLTMSGCSRQLYTAIVGSEEELRDGQLDQVASSVTRGDASSRDQQQISNGQLSGETQASASHDRPIEPPPLPRGVGQDIQARADAANSTGLQGDRSLDSDFLPGGTDPFSRGQGLDREGGLTSRDGSPNDGPFTQTDSPPTAPNITAMTPTSAADLSPLKNKDFLGDIASLSGTGSPDAQGQDGFGKRGALDKDLGDVFFDFDAALIRSDAESVLEANANALRVRHPNKPILIEGHCDERGTAEYNLVLGERRAHATKQYLVDLGVPASTIRIVSYGKEKPFCTASQPDCWKLNRRGHFVLQ